MSVLVSPAQFENCWGYKYVRFADGVVLFCDAGNPNGSHKQVVDEYQAAPAAFAGTIKVKDKRWYICEGGSTTAKLRRGESDEKYIGKVLERFGYRYDHELMYE